MSEGVAASKLGTQPISKISRAAGSVYPPTHEAWEKGAAEVGCNLQREVARIVVSRLHQDHLGAARWLQERSRAPVYMLEEESPSRAGSGAISRARSRSSST